MTSVRKLFHITLKRCCVYRFSLQVFLLSMWKLETWTGGCRVDQLQQRWHSGMGFFTVICSTLNLKSTANRGGQANLFLSPQTLGLIRYRNLQISKVCQSVNRKSAIFLWLICKFLKNTAQLYLRTVLKVLFVNYFYVQFWIRAFYAMFVRRKSMYVFAEVLRPQITKSLCPQITNPKSATLAEGSQTLQII
jgi:hypothetical protein